ncbi:MAG: hypothetical protein ACQEQE_06275 [Bacillota bacterium]
MIQIIIAIFLVALAVVILLSWGYVKEQKKSVLLYKKMINELENKVYKKLYEKKDKKLNLKEIKKIIKNYKTSIHWTKNQISVKNSKKISDQILRNLIKKEKIRKIDKYNIELKE